MLPEAKNGRAAIRFEDQGGLCFSLEKGATMWTRQSLQALIQQKLGDYRFVVVSNREPYTHIPKGRKTILRRNSGGVVTALDPVMQVARGLWVASGDSTQKCKEEVCEKVQVPTDNPSYTLRRIHLTKEEEEGYYYGFANEALWPLCHTVFQRPVFRWEDWEQYKKVNRRFAQAILEEIGNTKAFVWIHDYHFCLLSKYLKEMAPNQIITAHFWHIPFPNDEAFRICPQKRELLEGLLCNDLFGFHIRLHCNNFMDVVDRTLECKIDRERHSIIRGGKETLVRPYPISVDFETIEETARSEETHRAGNALREEFHIEEGCRVLLGLDRIDYTKGIPERLMAVDRLLNQHPELKGTFCFVQMGEISRLHIPCYKNLNDEINALVEKINWNHSNGEWSPIILTRRHLSFQEVLAFYQMSEVCLVTALHDGMNLVAKEFVASRHNGSGHLILSQFTGSARELTEATLINPYDSKEVAQALHIALTMSPEEAARRMTRMRATVSTQNIFRWAGKIISDLLKLEFCE